MSAAKHIAHAKWHLGRSSNSGIHATIFGAYGFLGRYVVNRLARHGARIVVPYRGDDYDVKHLRPMGDLGQIVPVEMSIRSYDEIQEVIAGSNVVINMIGKPFETRRFDFDQVNVQFPRALGAACLELGVERVLHFSALGASPSAESKWLKTKYLGEKALREEYPEATVLRPATVVGPEDNFFNCLGELTKLMPVLPLIHGPNSRQQPVYCLDVAAAVQEILKREDTIGQTIALAGPTVYTNLELYDHLFKSVRRPNSAVRLPRALLDALGSACSVLPKPTLTKDLIATHLSDLSAPAGMPGLRELGIEPTPMEEITDYYLKRFRPPASQTVDEVTKLPYSMPEK